MDRIKLARVKNYFSDRIEEIKKGTYVPTYKQIKTLPEFEWVSEETFKVARKEWFLQHFGMRAKKFAAHLKAIKESNLSELDRNNYIAQLEETKPQYISETESKAYAIKKLKRSANNGLYFLVPGVILLVISFFTENFFPAISGADILILIVSIMLMIVGILNMIYEWIKVLIIKNNIEEVKVRKWVRISLIVIGSLIFVGGAVGFYIGVFLGMGFLGIGFLVLIYLGSLFLIWGITYPYQKRIDECFYCVLLLMLPILIVYLINLTVWLI